MQVEEKSAKPKAKPKPKIQRAPVVASFFDRFSEPSTWAGILTIGATFATGGVSSWLNPTTLPALITGVGLILAKEAKPGSPS